MPLPFSGDEHVTLDGVDQPLLPPKTFFSFHHSPWSPVIRSPAYWSSADFDTQYQPSIPVGSTSQKQGVWLPVSPEAVTPLTPTVCSFDCDVHTEAYHDALVLLNRRNQLPAQFIHGWQSTRTDEIVSWFVQQEHVSSPASLICADGQVHQPTLPTRQDGEMLRVCKWSLTASPPSQGKALRLNNLGYEKKLSTSSLASKHPLTASPTSLRTCIQSITFLSACTVRC